MFLTRNLSPRQLLSLRLLRGAQLVPRAPVRSRSLLTTVTPLHRLANIATSQVCLYSTQTESHKGKVVQREFQAETQKLLQIVANSLYSEKEVFVRELVSNASDALEKLRHVQLMSETILEPERPLEIHITTNDLNGTLTISDSGIGMVEEELIQNLGTIAHSGSKEFIEKIQSDQSTTARENIIGQFGVGFYSAFMVADKITVTTRSATGNVPGYRWTSDGSGKYEIEELDTSVSRGTTIEMKLKESCRQFGKQLTVEGIIKKYSNFVGFPIFLNGTKMNTIEPLWMLNKDSVTPAQHTEFYRFISKATDEPRFTLHYATDAPLMIRTILYVPKRNIERVSMRKAEPGVGLYARKVLIQSKAKEILPDWLVFLKGVCDCEDIPLNLSRELLQDSALISKLRNTLSTRVIKWLAEEANKDAESYNDFYLEFGSYIREGAVTDHHHRKNLAQLLRFPSSKESSDKSEEAKIHLVSLREYVDRMKPGQKGIYFLACPSKGAALSSPYYEPFKLDDIEVLFLFDPADEFVLSNLGEYEGKEFINIDSEHVELDTHHSPEPTASPLSEQERTELVDYLKGVYGSLVTDVKISKRLVSHPAMIVGHESETMRRLLRMMDANIAATAKPLSFTYKLELNPSHPIIVDLFRVKNQNPEIAEVVAKQILDNALIAAGAMEDPRTMLTQLNHLMEAALRASPKNS